MSSDGAYELKGRNLYPHFLNTEATPNFIASVKSTPQLNFLPSSPQFKVHKKSYSLDFEEIEEIISGNLLLVKRTTATKKKIMKKNLTKKNIMKSNNMGDNKIKKKSTGIKPVWKP